MNAILLPSSIPLIVENVAWTLLHFVWQGVLIAATLAATIRLGRVRGSAVRYHLSVLALVAMCAAPVITLTIFVSTSRTSPPHSPSANWPDKLDVRSLDALPFEQFSMVIPVASDLSLHAERPSYWSMTKYWIVFAWVTGVTLFGTRLLLGWIGVMRLRRKTVTAPGWLIVRMKQMSHTLRMAVPLLRVSAHVSEAVAVGFLKPMVLFPAAWLAELPPDILESVIAHELAHIRRHDLWVNLTQRLVEAVLFYHPAVWWLSNRIRTERELCCDEIAVDLTRNPLRYAETLEAIGRLSLATEKSLFTVSVTGTDALLNRVRNVLGQRERSSCGFLAGVIPLSVVCLVWWSTVSVSTVSAESSDPSPAESASPIAADEPVPAASLLQAGPGHDAPEWWGHLPEAPMFESVRPTREPAPDPWENWRDDTAEFGSQVAATVNGTPILVEEVLVRYGYYLTQLRQRSTRSRMTPADYIRTRDSLIRRNLPGHILRRVLCERFQSQVSPEQLRAFAARYEEDCEKSLLRDMKVSTRAELEVALQERGTTLAKIMTSYVEERMAADCVLLQVPPVEVADTDIEAYYHSHLEEFTSPATMTWDEIQVSYSVKPQKKAVTFAIPANRLEPATTTGSIVRPLTDSAAGDPKPTDNRRLETSSREEAQLKIEAAARELKSGATLESVVDKNSDGATVVSVRRWSDMDPSSLVDTKLARTLEELPIDELSPIHEGKSCFQIVRVRSRQPVATLSLKDATPRIREKLNAMKRAQQIEQYFKAILAEAVIETRYGQ
jgi:beta-lactamase regulating signal transducer with metallopeptidase domain